MNHRLRAVWRAPAAASRHSLGLISVSVCVNRSSGSPRGFAFGTERGTQCKLLTAVTATSRASRGGSRHYFFMQKHGVVLKPESVTRAALGLGDVPACLRCAECSGMNGLRRLNRGTVPIPHNLEIPA